MAKRLTGGSLLSSSVSAVSVVVGAAVASALAASSCLAQPANAAATAMDNIRTCGFFTAFMVKRLRPDNGKAPRFGANTDISRLRELREVSKVRGMGRQAT